MSRFDFKGLLANPRWWLVGVLGNFLLRAWYSTVRCREIGVENLEGEHGTRLGAAVFALWHGRLLGHCYNNRDRGIGVMVSQHRDGNYTQWIGGRLGFISVRGSSTRGGASAMKGMLRMLAGGHDLAFTVDGPRGPVFSIKDGVIYAAGRSGCPLIPASVGYSRYWQLKSWDGFRLPKPFCTMVVGYGQPLKVPRKPDERQMEYLRGELRRRIHQVAAACDLAAGKVERPRATLPARMLTGFLTRTRDRWYHLPLLAVLLPFEGVYRLLWRVRQTLYRHGKLPVSAPPVPALCVGSLHAGGSGKTPLAVHLAARLAAAGERVAVLSRGYRGQSSRREPVVIPPGSVHGENIHQLAHRAGDEPVLIARLVPAAAVVVCAERAEAARAAVKQCGATVLVLDDGFGHRALGRNLDLLSFSAKQLFSTLHTFPAGYLREPPAAAERAGAIAVVGPLLTRYAPPNSCPQLPSWAAGKPLLRFRRAVRGVATLQQWRWPQKQQGQLQAIRAALAGRKVLAFCALASPGSFQELLAWQQPQRLELLCWPDHHAYSPREQRELRSRADRDGALLVTTEKDAVKLDPALVGDNTLVVRTALEEHDPSLLDPLLEKLTAPDA